MRCRRRSVSGTDRSGGFPDYGVKGNVGWELGTGKWGMGNGEVGESRWVLELGKKDLVFEFGSLVCHTILPLFGEAVVALTTSKGMWPFAHPSLIILIFWSS